MLNRLAVFVLLFSLVGMASAALGDGINFYWSFDDAATSGSQALDISGTGLNGNATGVTSGYNGILGQAYYFDGTAGDRVQPANAQGLSAPEGSISAWFNSSNTGSQRLVWGNREQAASSRFYFGQDTNLFYRRLVGTTASSGTITANQWNHVVLIYNLTNNTCTFYINGAVNTGLSTTTLCTTSAFDTTKLNFQWSIGSYGLGSGILWLGTIDEVGAWSRVLTKAEIDTLYNNGTAYNPFTSVTVTNSAPLNNSYTFNQTQPFTFDVSLSSGTWNATLYLNDTAYGTNNSITSSGTYTIYPSTIPAGEYTWYVNATKSDASASGVSQDYTIYVIGAAASTSCIVDLGNAYYRPNNCQDI